MRFCKTVGLPPLDTGLAVMSIRLRHDIKNESTPKVTADDVPVHCSGVKLDEYEI